ncbi:MAG: class I SAM-dependent methyltransferase [Planctomycetota bacterium]|nr:class I SAM-dependent methyltransferase [Planctomycetota bacterium]MEE3218772.1 class I SAM-dependent methyltransferase [Planctomycetota bacterium]
MPLPNDQPPASSAIHEHNCRAWDQFAINQKRFTKPISNKDFTEALKLLDADGWFEGRISGSALLCLGSGGGRQSVLYAAAGAEVTVVDISAEMLAIDRIAAEQRKLHVNTVQTSIDDLSPLATSSFDIVVHPVSTCYVPDVVAVYRNVARVTTPGGLYISQHKQPGSLQAAVNSSATGYELTEPYYRTGPLPEVADSPHREEGTMEFLHRWQELIGGLCGCGFVIEDLVEPFHAKHDAKNDSFAHRSLFAPPYVRIKARRVKSNPQHDNPEKFWTPD